MENTRLEQVHEFLLTCPVPLWETLLIDVETVDTSELQPIFADILVPLPENIVRRIPDVTGIEILRKRANYNIEIMRSVPIDEFRVKMMVSLEHFINWLNKMNAVRTKPLDPDYNPKIPRFSHTNYEIMSATGGFRAAQIVESTRQVSVFVVSIHFDYDEIP